MAESMFNIYKSLAEESDAPRQAALDYSKIREGGVAAAVMAQSAGMLGGQAMEAMGYQTAPQMQAQAMEEIKALYPNPTTRQDFIGMANEFKNRGMMDMWEKVMGVVDDLAGSTDMKKWQSERDEKRNSIRREAKRRGYTLSEDQITDIASPTKMTSSMHQLSGNMINPWMDELNRYLENLTPDSEETGAKTPGSVQTSASKMMSDKYRTDTLGKGFDDFKVETKKMSDSMGFNTAGLILVDQLDAGQSAALPPLKKALSTLVGDDRISMMEIQQATKIGPIGQRITDWFSEFASGDLSPETKSQIRSLFRVLGQYDEKMYNEKAKHYRDKYHQFEPRELQLWFTPKETESFYTQDELKLKKIREAIREKKGAK